VTGEPADDVAVKVDGVSKTFRLPQEQVHTLKERVLHPPRRPSFEALHALRDVSFEIRSGEVFGIVGRNGSGKSTLMKCLAGIYQADAGEMWLRGRMAPFIELGVGFNTDLTAYDNVLVNAVMLGLNPDEARRRYDSILDFAELHEFAELKLKNYSSGMLVRLAFSVMVHVDADLLLIDEVLAVGDAAFQQKCYDSVNRLRREGKTIVLVTHDMGAVERFCDRALLLERGRVAAIGEATSVSRRYTAVNFAVTERTTAEFRQAAGGAGEAREGAALEIASVWTQDAMGVRGQSTQGRPCALIMNMTFRRALRDPIFAFAVHDEQGRRVLVVTSEHAGPTGDFDAGEQIATGASFDMWLAPGRYSVTALVSDPGRAQSVVAVAEDAASVVVSGADARGGMVDVRHDFFVERAMRPQAHSAGTAGG
jgi:ABC-type polysaccharide/polyol phosphate transport system ATPase subunit